ncbi:hypothetical protein BDV93DRAFT_561053 [Ceratobasidium sp. AG-I]|nr:hypothetical protein BDV93DRAFT_561053 [Ceratobasidium sp. AG-I]
MAIRSIPVASLTSTNIPVVPEDIGAPNLPEPDVAIEPGPQLDPDTGPSPPLKSLYGIQLTQRRPE